jgi:catechol 2,3-dioxygenase-like lactoylglutathione lyase family enzyme
MPIESFFHVKLDIEDVNASLAFYCGKLQFKEIVRYQLPEGGLIIQLSPTGAPPGIELWYENLFSGFRNDRLHIAFSVSDIESVVNELKGRGVMIEQEPFRKGHELIAFIRDPDGYLIELNEDTSSHLSDTPV